jgi:hypothetical protein
MIQRFSIPVNEKNAFSCKPEPQSSAGTELFITFHAERPCETVSRSLFPKGKAMINHVIIAVPAAQMRK